MTKVYNRKTKQIIEVPQYSEGKLKFLYNNPFGRILLRFISGHTIRVSMHGLILAQPVSAKLLRLLPNTESMSIILSDIIPLPISFHGKKNVISVKQKRLSFLQPTPNYYIIQSIKGRLLKSKILPIQSKT